MRPEDTKLNIQPRGVIQPPDRSHVPAHAAVADMTRQQIDTIYNTQALVDQQPAGAVQPNAHPQHQQNPVTNIPAAYSRTHTSAHNTTDNQWQHYHSAWQTYYQKYYEHYYMGAVNQVHQTYTERMQAQLNQDGQNPVTISESATAADDTAKETISNDEALYDLRNQLVTKVHESSKKVRKSRHFVPIMAALAVLVVFGFLQYNSLIIANVKAYVTPGEIDPQNIIVDPSTAIKVGAAPLLIIPKINVNVPVDYDTKPDQSSQLKAMQNGTAYFGIPGANSHPGQIGNTVISGHSSNDYIEIGKYKFVFVQLERLQKGDVFYLNYKGTRYTYTVTKKQIVAPTDVSALVYKTTKPIVTLITCTPVGTAQSRLLVTAEQVSPSVTNAQPAPSGSGSSNSSSLPGNSPTVLERLFGQ